MSLGTWDLPGPNEFFRTIYDDLSEDRNCIVFFPVKFNFAGLASKIVERHLEVGQFQPKIFELDPDRGENNTPIQFIVNQFSINAGDKYKIPSISDISNFTDWETDLIILSIERMVCKESIGKWLEFAAIYSREYRNSPNNLPSLCLIGPCTLPDFQSTDSSLSIHWWWNVMNPEDIYIQYKDSLQGSTAAAIWFRSVYMALAWHDIALMELLFKNNPRDFQSVFETLKKYGTSWCPEWKESNKKDINELGLLSKRMFGDSFSSPPKKLMHYWMNNIINYDRRLGIVVHPAIFALHGLDKHIQQIIWVGQIKEIMGLLDCGRIGLVNYLERKYGEEWKRFLRDKNQRNQNEYELSTLWDVIYSMREQTNEHKNISSLSYWLKETRNKLVHHEILSYEYLNQGINKMQKTQNLLFGRG